MAEESEITAVNSLDNNVNLKRKKLDEQLPASDDVSPPDSSEIHALDADEPSKRPRFDELASENGHTPDADNGNNEETAEPVDDVDDAEATVDDAADGDEIEEEAIPQNPEDEQIDDVEDGNSDEIGGEENIVKTSGEEVQEPVSQVVGEEDSASAAQHSDSGSKSASKKIEIPNNKVGVLIGKSGETIKYLQINSGAKIQITRDADADRHATTRTVELVGNPESLIKAERLIKDVMAEADAGGSPALVARGLSAALTSGSNEVEIPVPGDKVGLIIGRGGETIRNLQSRSGARIQLIQNNPGEQSKEKKVKITGDRKQVEAAKELIREVMNQQPGRQSSGNNYNQENYRPRGPGGAPQWGDRGPPSQPMQHNYHHQRGPPYPSHTQSYPPPYHGPPRGNFNSGWENRPPTQGPPHNAAPYDYYGQGGGHAPNAPAPHLPAHSQGNYNHNQPRAADYTHPTPPPVQNYGQPPVQQPYSGQGYAPPQQQGYPPQQQYTRPPPSYGMPSQGPPQGYAPPAASQSTDAPYQAAAPQPYTQNVPSHQQYPPYGAAPVTNDPYTQPQPTGGYTQPGPQPTPAYAQQAGVYGQYPQAAQPGYDQTSAAAATGAATYGYQGQVDPSAYAAAGQPYGAALAQPGYGQPAANQAGYDQLAAQAGAYAAASAPAAVAPTAYAPQQMYAAPR